MRDTVKKKLYKTALAVLLVFGGIGFITTAVMSGHDWWIASKGARCFQAFRKDAKDSFIPDAELQRCNIYISEYKNEVRVPGAWIDPSVAIDAEWPMWVFILCPLWLLPAFLLILSKRWVIWVLK